MIPVTEQEELKSLVLRVLNHNVPSAYLVSSKTYEKLLEIVDAYELGLEVKKRLNEDEEPIEVSLSEL